MRWLREWWAAWTAPAWPYRQSVLVNTLSDQTFRGVLWEKSGEFLVLKSTEMAKNRAEWIRIDGDVVIPRESVEFIQVLGVR